MSQDNISINPATTAGGPSISADQLADNSVAQQVKILDGTPGSNTPLKITSGGHALVLQPDTTFSGALAQSTDTIVQSGLNNYNTLTFFVSGTWSGEIRASGSIDGVNYVDLMPFDVAVSQVGYGYPQNVAIQYNSTFKTSVSGYAYVKFYFQAYTSGSASITASLTAASASPLDGFVTLTDPNNDYATNVNVTNTPNVAFASPPNVNVINTPDVNVINAMTLATGSNTIGSLAANQSVNVTQFNGGTIQTGNGSSGGALRVTLSNDSAGPVTISGTPAVTLSGSSNAVNATIVGTPAVTVSSGTIGLAAGANAIGSVTLGTGANIIGALSANQSVNLNQVGGTSIGAGNGVSTGALRVTLSSDSTGQVKLAAGANIIGALTANQSVNSAQVNGVTIATGNGVTGTGVQRVTLSSDSTGQVTLAAGSNAIGSVTVTGTPTVTLSGSSNAVNATIVGTPAVTISGSSPSAGDVAAGSTDSGNPVKIGGKALNVVPTSVTTGQRTNALFDTMGRLVTTPQIRQGVLFKSTTITASTTATTIIPAVASTYNDLTQLVFSNGDEYATAVTISDGTNTLGTFNVPAGGGFVIPFATPVSQTTVNTNWTATCSVAVSSLYVCAVYQTSK